MIDGINALIQAFGMILAAMFNAPFYGSVTWGMFLVAAAIMSILLSFFVNRMK